MTTQPSINVTAGHQAHLAPATTTAGRRMATLRAAVAELRVRLVRRHRQTGARRELAARRELSSHMARHRAEFDSHAM